MSKRGAALSKRLGQFGVQGGRERLGVDEIDPRQVLFAGPAVEQLGVSESRNAGRRNQQIGRDAAGFEGMA